MAIVVEQVGLHSHLRARKFDKDILAGQSRDVSFTLKLSYVGLKLGCLPYEIKTSNSCYIGLVQGPLISR